MALNRTLFRWRLIQSKISMVMKDMHNDPHFDEHKRSDFAGVGKSSRAGSEESKINPQHKELRAFLRVLGPAMVGIGFIFAAIGFISFFSSFGSFGPPRYFWCAFVGLPLLGFGSAICKFAYVGAVARYIAAETAPVGKDTFNYIAEGTQDGVRNISSAIKEGLVGNADKTCRHCDSGNDHSASFCDNCGKPFSTKVVCPTCSAQNDNDANFCDGCGTKLLS